MSNYTSKKISFNTAEQFKESFFEPEPATLGFIFLGNHVAWPDEGSPPTTLDTVSNEKSIWDNMYAGKRVTGSDVELVLPRVNWTGNTKYRQYDDTTELSTLTSNPTINTSISIISAGATNKSNIGNVYITFTGGGTGNTSANAQLFVNAISNVVESIVLNSPGLYESTPSATVSGNANVTISLTTQNLKPVYVVTSDRNVYLCLSNNVSANSTVQPTGKNLTSNGNITTADNYIWKYLYNIRASNKFLTDDWAPAPTSTSRLDFDTSSVISVDGELAHIVVTNAGSGYIHSTINVSAFASGCSTLTVANTTNVTANMSISATGIATGTHIASVDTVNTKIQLSSATTANGGGSGNNASISTRVYILGDGIGGTATTTLSGNTIQKITMTTNGKNYSNATISIFGTGSNASARVVLPPKFGHGFNSAKQLNASNVMIATRIGEVDSTENGVISANTTFRQYGLLRDPYKYNTTVAANTSTANSVFSQTTNITLVAGTAYNLNEFVFQGPSSNASTFSGFVNDQTSNTIKLTRVTGSLVNGVVLKGSLTNPSGRVVVTSTNPEFQPYTGDIMYEDNIVSVQRTDGQAESLKFVIQF